MLHRERLRREAQALALSTHPDAAATHDVGTRGSAGARRRRWLAAASLLALGLACVVWWMMQAGP